MQISSFLGLAAVYPFLIKDVLALVDTSPAIILSNTQTLRTGLDSKGILDIHSVDQSVADSVANCGYDAYIFVNHLNVSNGDVNRNSMPFLTHAIEKAASSFAAASVFGLHDRGLHELLTAVQSNCRAISIQAQPHHDDPLPAIEETQPKVISVEFEEGSSPAFVDETLRKIIGHTPSGNFFLYYSTTPRQRRADKNDNLVGEANSEHPTENLPYESVFRNYQFFSPAILMGLFVSALLMAVFFIALNSVGSLQISTAAFEPKRQSLKKNQ